MRKHAKCCFCRGSINVLYKKRTMEWVELSGAIYVETFTRDFTTSNIQFFFSNYNALKFSRGDDKFGYLDEMTFKRGTRK